jgi:hypothetical protein
MRVKYDILLDTDDDDEDDDDHSDDVRIMTMIGYLP